MAIGDVLDRSAPTPLGGWNLPPWIGLILRKVRHALLSDEEKKLLEVVEFGATTFGAPLLDAADLDDLDARMDSILESREFAQFYAQLLSEAPILSDPPLQSAPISPREVTQLGIGAPDAFAKALEITLRALRVRQQMQGRIKPQQIARVSKTMQEMSILAFCLDPSLPPEIGLVLLGWFRTELCGLAFGEMIRAKGRIEPWLAMGIAQRWLEGAENYLRFLASIPGVDVSVDWVPLEQRIDLQRIEAEHRAERERIKELFDQAEASGAPIYPPEGFDADD